MTLGVVYPWPCPGLPWCVMYTADLDHTIVFPDAARVELRLKYGSVWREQSVSPLTIREGQHVRVTQRENP